MRPYWHLDAKWLAALACLAAIVVASGLYSFSKLTERDAATGIFTGIMTSFAKEGDGEEAFTELQAVAAASPDEEFTIEGVTLPVKGGELAGLTYDEAVELVVGRIASTLYTDGPDAVEQYFAGTPEAGPEEGPGGEDEEVGLGPFSLLTEDSHDTVTRIFTFSLVPVLLLAVLLAFFSRRFGRLGSPGIVLAAGTAPFALLWFIVRQATKGADGEGVDGALAEALSPVAGGVAGDFLMLFILGVVLTVAAVVGHIAFALWRRFRPTPAPTDEEAPPAGEPEEQPGYTVGEGLAESGRDELPDIGPGGGPQA